MSDLTEAKEKVLYTQILCLEKDDDDDEYDESVD